MELVGYLYFSIILPVLFTVGFVVFIWGSFQYFIAGGHDEEAKEKSKSLMVYGLLLFGLMVILYGIGKSVGAAFS